MFRFLTLALVLVACIPADDEALAPASAAPPGTQIGGIDEADDLLKVTVVDHLGQPVTAEVSWNPDGDEFRRTKTCPELCYLEVYGGFIDYDLRGSLEGFEDLATTVPLGAADAVGAGDYHEAEVTLAFVPAGPPSEPPDCLPPATVEVLLVDVAGGAPVHTGTVTWNPDQDAYTLDRSCDGRCWVELYGGVGAYSLTADIGTHSETVDFELSPEHYQFDLPEDCGGMPYHETTVEIVLP